MKNNLMESLVNNFSNLTTTTTTTHADQLYFMKQASKQYLKNGCTEQQYISFYNFNQLIIRSVDFSPSIYSERVIGLLYFITDKIKDFNDPDIHTRLLASYQFYDAITTLLIIEEEVEGENTYNYYKEPHPSKNNDFWYVN
jgi:hypothetical protein